ncbi:MAG: hypothetical protein ACI3XS_05115 [Eubacteriales bacterium]
MNENNFEDILSSVMSNEDLMGKISGIVKSNKSGDVTNSLPDVIAALSPVINGNKKNDSENKDEQSFESNIKSESEKSNTAETFLKSGIDSGNILSLLANSGRSSKLLLALKPYVSKERKEMIDTIVRVSQIADIIKTVR